MRDEHELAMMLHGAKIMGIRKHVYGMPMPADLSDLVALYVQTFLPGAVLAIHRFHREVEQPSLTVQQLGPFFMTKMAVTSSDARKRPLADKIGSPARFATALLTFMVPALRPEALI